MDKNLYRSALNKVVLEEEKKNKLKDLYKSCCEENKEENIVSLNNVKNKRNFRIRPIGMIAASLAFVIALGAFMTFGISTKNSNDENSFILTVNAAEVKPNKASVINIGTGGFSISEDDNYNDTYGFEVPIECKGKNIESITYTVNRGALRVATDDIKRIKAYKKTNRYSNTGGSCNKYSKVFLNCSQFTIDYKNQNEKTIFNVVGDSTMLSNKDQEYLKNHKNELYNLTESISLQKEKEALDILFKDIVITATVKFKDGSSQAHSMKLGTKIMKVSQAFPDEELSEKSDTEDVFLTLTLV